MMRLRADDTDRCPSPETYERSTVAQDGDSLTHPECPTGQVAEYPVSSIDCSPSESDGGLLLPGLGIDETGSHCFLMPRRGTTGGCNAYRGATLKGYFTEPVS
jgi:hypothetical protein